jgi:hypothetical protein
LNRIIKKKKEKRLSNCLLEILAAGYYIEPRCQFQRKKKNKIKSNYGLEQYRKRIENFDREMNHVTDIRSQDGPDHRSKERIAKIKKEETDKQHMSRKNQSSNILQTATCEKEIKKSKKKSANMRNELRTVTGDESPKR